MSFIWILIFNLLGLAQVQAQNASCVYGICSSGLPTLSEDSLLELTTVPSESLVQLEAYSKNLGLDWSFELDGCDARARAVVMGLEREMGVLAGTVRIQAPRGVSSRFIPWNPEITWGHHTAAFFKLEDRHYVIDYALFEKPVELEVWLGQLTYGGLAPEIEYSNRFFVNPQVNSASAWFEMDVAAFEQSQQLSAKYKAATGEVSQKVWKVFLAALSEKTFFKQHISDLHTFWGDSYQLEPGAADQSRLEPATHCQETRDRSKTMCTSYLPIDGQTCYFKWDSQTSGDIQISEELICF